MTTADYPTFKDVNEARAWLTASAVETEARIAERAVSEAAATAAYADFAIAVKDLDGVAINQLGRGPAVAQHVDYECLRSYRETLTKSLIHGRESADLAARMATAQGGGVSVCSPAGFHPSQDVFVIVETVK